MQFIIAFTNIYANVSYFSNIDTLWGVNYVLLLAIQSFLKRPQFCKDDLAQIVKIWVSYILHIFGTDMKFAKNRPFWITQSSNWHPLIDILDLTANVLHTMGLKYLLWSCILNDCMSTISRDSSEFSILLKFEILKLSCEMAML